MTLLDDLQALDLSAVVGGKLDIAAALDVSDLQALLGDGAVATVLGDLGTAVSTAVAAVEDPSTLVEPLAAALLELLDSIGADLPLAQYASAVADGARIVAGLVGALSGDPLRLSMPGTGDAGDALARVADGFGDQASAVAGGAEQLRSLVQLVDRGLPRDPAALVGVAMQILLPFGTAAVDPVRGWARTVDAQLDRVRIDPRLGEGLVVALGRLRAAADAGDVAAVRTALATLAEVRAATVTQLAAALRTVAGVLSATRVGDLAAPVRALRGALHTVEKGALDQLDEWRGMLADARGFVDGIDPQAALDAARDLLDDVERAARETVLGVVDQSVEVIKGWVRDLLRELPLRPLRQELSEAIARLARVIDDADLDAPVAVVRDTLTQVAQTLAEADPAALVASAVERLEGVVRDLVDAVRDALGGIAEGVEAVADEASEVLGRAVDGLRAFSEAAHAIVDAVGGTQIADTAAAIAAELRELREEVGEVVSSVELPEPLRAGVDQLVGLLDSIDLDEAVRRPLEDAASRLTVPPAVGQTVREGLQAVSDAISSLVPADLTAELDALLADAFDQLRSIDVSSLTSGVTQLLDDAAGAVEGVHLTELVAPASDVFAQVLGAVDRVHPRTLLSPAIDLYRQLTGAIPVPAPDAIGARVGAVTAQAGEAAARAVVEPTLSAVGAGGSAPTTDRPQPTPPPDLRLGDVVRLVGYLPARLREALEDLGTGPVGEVLATIDDTLTGTAAALRATRDRLLGLQAQIEAGLAAALAPVGAAQLDAQLALRGSAALSAGGLDVAVSVELVGGVSPGALLRAVDGERAIVLDGTRGLAGALVGPVADDLENVAALLEAALPAGVLADADGLLAALDPEPLAAELDALFASIVAAVPGFLTAAGSAVTELADRVRALVEEFNPGSLAQRYLAVVEVLRDELALLDPARLADELGEVHAVVRATIAAYDPAVLAAQLDALLGQVAGAIRGLDPAHLMPDLSGVEAQVARIAQVLPLEALDGVGTQLEAVGDQLRALDVEGMLAIVDAIPPQVADGVSTLVEAIRDELVALLESIRYAGASASASVSVSASVG
ncbi:hypothetical protein [Cellulomonas sp. PSBB021]|uniref:hypothetical protein n=1 Tax=Cellulomonas sp. PSBB021 TaxID=2003551 RepID=UPI000B8D3CCD|nr:hypothetical protein [Cellulomonas sp. PSBB021]ASR54792.1 hypothetical protein CBP52_06355 [Cellulomonas sp. PSBB021]